MLDPSGRFETDWGRPYIGRAGRAVPAALAKLTLALLIVPAGFTTSHWANSESNSIFAVVALFGYPTLVALGVAFLHVWRSGERDPGRIGRGIGLGVVVGVGAFVVLFFVWGSSLDLHLFYN